MKIWYGYGSEHSANLVIIGTFDTVQDARSAQGLLQDLSHIARDDESKGKLKVDGGNTTFSEEFLKYCSENNFHWFGYDDPVDFLFDYDLKLDGDQVILTTEETQIEAFIKAMLHKGAKIEVYSAHDHPSPHGR